MSPDPEANEIREPRWVWLRGPIAGRPKGEPARGGETAYDEGDGLWRPFFPDLAWREVLAALVLLIALVVLAALTRPALQPSADPSVVGYVPRPEWYFLWLFELLKFFKGALEPLGTVVVPVGGIALMLALPFIDRRRPKTRSLIPRTRPVRVWPRIVAVVVVAFLVAMTALAATSSQSSTPAPAPTTAPGWPRRRRPPDPPAD